MTTCLYPHLTRKQAYCGYKGNRGCRCQQCCVWWKAYSWKTKAQRQAERDQELILIKKQKRKKWDQYPFEFVGFVKVKKLTIPIEPSIDHNATAPKPVSSKKQWVKREIRIEYEQCKYPGLTEEYAFGGKKGCRCKRCVNWYTQNRTTYWQNFKKLKQRDSKYTEVEVATSSSATPAPPCKPVYLSLEEEATAWAWTAIKAARTRYAGLGITVHLTPIECLRETELYKQCFILGKTTGIPHEVDHIVPVSKGGQHHPDNLQVLTRTENRRKGAKIL